MAETMRAAVFEGHERIVLEEKPFPHCGPTDAIVKVSLTTICGTDVHIWREEYPVEQGRIVGHEPVGTIHQLGDAVSGLRSRRASAGRRNHALRDVLLLPVTHRVPMLRI